MLEPVKNLKKVFYVDLENSNLDEVVKALGLGLLTDEMENVKKYFRKEGRKPTDVELQAIDQAWSEHCCYKSSKPVLEETVFGLKSSKEVVAREDAGIMEFDDEHYYAVGLESHNHPSALDPYGGSATGIGGILRDVFTMGARPIALLNSIHFGSPSHDKTKNLLNNYYFYSGKVSQLYNGSVFQCSEDEVLISFNNEKSSDEHAFYAIRAAQLFLEVMRHTNDVLENATIAKYTLAVHSGNFLNGFYSPVTQRMDMLSGKTLDTLRAIAKECPEKSLCEILSAHINA